LNCDPATVIEVAKIGGFYVVLIVALAVGGVVAYFDHKADD